jgi:hypothetical protein
LQYSSGLQRRCEISSQFDGGGSADDAVVAWENHSGGNANGGTIEVATFDSATTDGSSLQSIGEQYCDANAHADSADGGRRSSFISARGNASVGSTQYLHCDEMKLNAFAYFIVAPSTGNVNMPGSSVGRLCLSGSIGRVVGGTILNTGTSARSRAASTRCRCPRRWVRWPRRRVRRCTSSAGTATPRVAPRVELQQRVLDPLPPVIAPGCPAQPTLEFAGGRRAASPPGGILRAIGC